MLPHEKPLRDGHPNGFHRSIGGSAGQGTYGGDIEKPPGMPDTTDYTVSTYDEMRDACQNEGAVIGYDAHIDFTGRETINVADGVTIVGGYCDPDVPGTGPWLHHDDETPYTRRFFEHGYGEPCTLYGVYMLGPRLHYFDPDHTSDNFDDLHCAGFFEYAPKNAGTFKAIGCRFTGFTVAGIEFGARGYETEGEVRRSTFTRNNMEHLGYGIEQYNGNLWVDRSFFDRCRHGIAGAGQPTEYLDLTESVFGPNAWSSHLIDRHGIDERHPDPDIDAYIAGGHIRIRNCSIMGTWDVGGYPQEGEAIRGASIDQSRTYLTHFWHDEDPEQTDAPPNTVGAAVRQEVESDTFQNLQLYDNLYSPDDYEEGIGAPPAETDQSGQTVSEDPPQDTNMEFNGAHNLVVTGHGVTAKYWLYLDGKARTAKLSDSSEVVKYGDRTVMSGHVVGGKDAFEISKDATLVGAWFDGPATVTVDGNQVTQMPSLIAAETDRRI